MTSVPSLIERKRDGGCLTDAEIAQLVSQYVTGDLPDYQMAALAMAICLNGMTADETTALTLAMLRSGSVLKHPAGSGQRVVDKHSTGGIGDKTSLILAPLLASAGYRVPMISGRGLGITGGTLDKLESIPGFRTDLSLDEIDRQLDAVGCVITGQTPELCPADRKLYALRDVTGTVPSRPLIVSSIMSKKLAESLDALVLDVKFGSGAFMKQEGDAQKLADEMIAVGRGLGVDVTALLSPMDEPLGQAVGNALEVVEAIRVLEGQNDGGSADLRELVLDLAVQVTSVGRGTLESLLDSGGALEKWREMVKAQGGDAFADVQKVHRAKVIREVPASTSGVLTRLDAGIVGRVALELGAGREKAGDMVDHTVGFSGIRKTGSHLEAGEPCLVVHAASERSCDLAIEMLLERAIEIDGAKPNQL